MGQRIPEKEIANFQAYGEIESMHEFEFVDMANSYSYVNEVKMI